jgi:hypothetical protein
LNDCPETIKTNYKYWHELVSRSKDGDILSLSDAYDLTQEDFVKEVRPTPSYRGYLYLGNPLDNTHFIAINIYMYLRTKEVKPPGTHKWSSLSNGPTYSVVSDSKYLLDTGDNKEGVSETDEVEIPKEELERAYKYGKTIVRITEEEMKYQQAKTRKEMAIIGFIPAATVKLTMIWYSVLSCSFDLHSFLVIISTQMLISLRLETIILQKEHLRLQHWLLPCTKRVVLHLFAMFQKMMAKQE